MKDKFYGDNRDLVKWGGIVHLCHEKHIKTVLQVAYYRKDEWGKTIDFNGKSIALSDAIIKHFRDIKDIKRLSNRDLDIQVFDREFNKDRKGYTKEVCEEIKRINRKKLVFLDPDTGLAPDKCEADHVMKEEMWQIWKSLSREYKDILVFYQHNTHISGWKESNIEKLSEWCRVDQKRVKMWSSTGIAGDVVFYFIER